MVMKYQNAELVADLAMPVKKLRGKGTSFKFAERNLADSFTIPDTSIGRASKPNQATFSITERGGVCEDHGLGSFIPWQDIDEAEGQVGDLVSDALNNIMNLVLLRREARVAEIVGNQNNYLPEKVLPIATSDKFDKPDSDPLKFLLKALDKNLVRPNRVIMSQPVWTALRTHPKIVKAMHGNAGDSGVANRQIIAELLEVKEVIIGVARVNVAKKGETINFQDCWGNFVAMHYYESVADASNGLAWGMTFQSGERIASSDWNNELGLRGGYNVKAGACWAETVTAKGAGMLLTGVIS
jgi:hypothetical protein